MQSKHRDGNTNAPRAIQAPATPLPVTSALFFFAADKLSAFEGRRKRHFFLGSAHTTSQGFRNHCKIEQPSAEGLALHLGGAMQFIDALCIYLLYLPRQGKARGAKARRFTGM